MISRLISMRYEVLERVGEGALFQVYKARDKNAGRVVALKSLQSSYASDPVIASALRKTMADLTGLSHPNIARVEEVVDDDGAPVVITEFVRGINLKDRIRRIAPFTLSVAVDFAIAVAEALQQAHAQGILHGDLRPHNVIVSPEGAVKVTDFGLHRVLAVSQEAAGSNLGRAVHYQAPEIVSGAAPTVATDLYALGVILFEMLTGGLPFPGETPLVVAMKHQNEAAPSPRSLNPGVPRSLEGIVMKLLLKQPDDRYRAASFLLNDLKTVRDALRFGKPLSWSPLENDVLPGPQAPVTAAGGSRTVPASAPLAASVAGAGLAAAAAAAAPPTPRPTAVSPGGTAAPSAPAGSPPAGRMSTPMVRDDRISPYLKLALATVMVIILTVGIAGVAVWMATFAKPDEKSFPKLVGMKVEDARQAAEKVSMRLMEHEEYNDKYPAGTVWRTDPDLTGRTVRPGRSINIWISKGSKMVYVPDVTKLKVDEAEAKLKDAGLALGTVDRQNNSKIEFDHVISQNPRGRKRVDRDLQVNLMVSDGPAAAPEPDTPEPQNPPDNPNGISGTTDAGSGDSGASSEPRSVTLSKKIPRDGNGTRRVRIEYDDAQGSHQAVDEYHDEGDEVKTKVMVVGSKIVVRVYYGEDKKLVKEQTQTIPRNP